MEKETIVPFSSFTEAVHYCFASYYVSNISYPPDIKPLMLLLETYVYGLKPSLKEPLSVTLLKDNLRRFFTDEHDSDSDSPQ